MSRFGHERQPFLMVDPADADEIAGNLLLVLNRKMRDAVAEAKDRGIQTCHAGAGAGGFPPAMADAIAERLLARLTAKPIRGVEVKVTRRVDVQAKNGTHYVQAVLNLDLAAMGVR